MIQNPGESSAIIKIKSRFINLNTIIPSCSKGHFSKMKHEEIDLHGKRSKKNVEMDLGHDNYWMSSILRVSL